MFSRALWSSSPSATTDLSRPAPPKMGRGPSEVNFLPIHCAQLSSLLTQTNLFILLIRTSCDQEMLMLRLSCWWKRLEMERALAHDKSLPTNKGTNCSEAYSLSRFPKSGWSGRLRSVSTFRPLKTTSCLITSSGSRRPLICMDHGMGENGQWTFCTSIRPAYRMVLL